MLPAAIAFWAVFMALYVFMTRLLIDTSEEGRKRQGLAFWEFFSQVDFTTILIMFVVIVDMFALWFENDGLLLLGAVFFAFTLIIGVLSLKKEIGRTRQMTNDYAKELYYQQQLAKLRVKALRRMEKSAPPGMSKAQMEEAAAKEAEERARKAVEGSVFSQDD